MNPPGHDGTVFALDHSRAATGVAIGNLALGSARGLAVLRQRDEGERIGALGLLVREWAPVLLVLGLPLDRDGGEQAQSRRARRFGEALHAALGLPVILHDERYTTVVAEDALRAGGARAAAVARHADAEAAREILRGYLDARPFRTPVP